MHTLCFHLFSCNNLSLNAGYIHTTIGKLPFYSHVIRARPQRGDQFSIYNQEFSFCKCTCSLKIFNKLVGLIYLDEKHSAVVALF